MSSWFERSLARPVGRLVLITVASASPFAGSRADTVVLAASKDNTLYEHFAGSLSNGAGSHFFVGQTGQQRAVRGVLEFDIAGALPAGATVQTAMLTLVMSRTRPRIVITHTISLHPLLDEWGEGTSNASSGEGRGATSTPGDATWIHSMFNTSFWASAGGDFSATPSASTDVTGLGSYSWASPELAADVQLFLDDPAQNHGWAVIGNESTFVAKRFNSRESGSTGPMLTIEFAPPVNAPPNCSLASPSLRGLWPPNHHFRQVSIEGVTDPDADPITITITKVFQDERLDDPGSGNTCPDAAGVGTDVALLLDERNGGSDGSVYHVTFSAADGRGGHCTGTVAVCQLHDQGQGEQCVDGGPLFDSTGPCEASRDAGLARGTDATNPASTPGADPVVTAVPALSAWGLALLVALLASTMIWMVRRERVARG